MKRTSRTVIAMAVAQLAWMAGTAHAQEADSGSVVVVTGQRAALNSAQKIKQDSDEIVDSVVADDIGKLPDRSVTEVLQRVVGVSINRQAGDNERFSVEGAGVNIRGLNYVRSELNGREAFAANGGRSLSWGDIPPELMSGVDVYKNPSAEQTEGGISGLVNLRTALPFDFKGQRVGGSLEVTHSTLRKGKPDLSGSLLYSNRWKNSLGEWGVLFDIASSDSSTRTDTFQFEPFYPRTDIEPGRTVWIPKGAQWRTYEYDRKRQGAYGALQWRMKDVRSHLTLFQSRYKDNALEQSIFSSAAPYDLQVSDATYDERGALLTGTISDRVNGGIPFSNAGGFNKGNSKTTDIGWNVEWKVSDDWTLSSDLQRTTSKADAFSSAVGLGMLMPSQRLDYRGKLPSIAFTDDQRTFLANPANYYWGSTMEHMHRNTGELKAWKGDARYTFDHPVLRDLRFGVRLTDREALTVNSDPSYNWKGVTQPWMIDWDIGKLAYLSDPRFNAPTVTNSFPNFFGGDISVPAVVFPAPSVAAGYPDSYQLLHSYHMLLCQEQRVALGGGTCEAWTPARFGGDNPAGTNDQREKTRAFYTQLRFGFDNLAYPVDGNIGVRYVQTRSRSRGYTSFRPGAAPPAGAQVTGLPVPVIPAFEERRDVKNDYNNVLPTLNLRLKASDKLQFRAAFGTSMSRPDFADLQAYTRMSQDIDSVLNEATGVTTVTAVRRTGTAEGNPSLKPITSRQLDLTAEWYFANSGSLTLALFGKRLKDVVIDQTVSIGLPDVQGSTQQFLVTSPVNGARGNVRGAEIAYQQYFDGLPDWLKGLGLQANYTYVDSHRKLYNPVRSEFCSGSEGGAANINLNMNGCDIDGRTFGDLPLAQMSKNAYNIAILFDRGPWSARLAYNWRSRYFLSTNTNGTRGSDGTDMNPASADFGERNVAWGLPLWADDYGQLDGGVSYKFSENFKVDFQAQNLSDARYGQTMHQGIGDKRRAHFVSGPRYSLRAGYSF
ncbi:TonB-dependent receptor [Pseudoduganella lutea]|uniref:TonB-dependent receptor n=1 Tax=Pseudoduganella lutea TaxID=321985 RepID=A0A4P6KRI9_9BURK|nr:TonB-dependent receptor [Pseudoduganella lutea]QBE61691.1 TonB-dependent receptor [Pseudoduganella lutea]